MVYLYRWRIDWEDESPELLIEKAVYFADTDLDTKGKVKGYVDGYFLHPDDIKNVRWLIQELYEEVGGRELSFKTRLRRALRDAKTL